MQNILSAKQIEVQTKIRSQTFPKRDIASKPFHATGIRAKNELLEVGAKTHKNFINYVLLFIIVQPFRNFNLI